MQIDVSLARKVLEVVDAGLSSGLGKRKPGEMCVEAAVCYAMDLPHGDKPTCVAPALRSLKIALNDKNWSSKTARAAGLRRLAIAQLGSAGALDEREFMKRVAESVIRKQVPFALRAAASIQKDAGHKTALIDAANKCEKEGTRASALGAKNAAYAADAYAYAADAAAYAAAADDDDAAKSTARDKTLAAFAEDIVQILIEMKAPGCEFLDLAPLPVTA